MTDMDERVARAIYEVCPVPKSFLVVVACFFLLISGKLVAEAVKRVDYIYIVLVLLAFPLFALGALTLLYVSGLMPLLFQSP